MLSSDLRSPRFEGSVRLEDGRKLGFAEFGPAGGRPLLWFHGTPGARRQVAPEARALADLARVRIVSVERPGIGDSTPHVYDAVVDFAADIEQLCDALGIDRFGLAGLSGGAPYALACAHQMPERALGVAVLGGVAPSVGDDALECAGSAALRALSPLLRVAEAPLGGVLRGLVRLFEPLADRAMDLFAAAMPPGDQRIFEDEATRRMFQQDLILGSRTQMRAIWLDAILFGRSWGFALGDLRVPVLLRYGDADVLVPLEHGRHLARRIPNAQLKVVPGEGHLGSLGASREIFEAMLETWAVGSFAASAGGASSEAQG